VLAVVLVAAAEARGIEMKADPKFSARGRQSAKIREISDALTATGYIFLDAQASVLGLPRSTTWKIRQADHKHSGLSAAVINRILAQPQLPAPVRTTIIEYVEAKSAGMYGHNDNQLRRFIARLSACLA
jgi:hypothetical protein